MAKLADKVAVITGGSGAIGSTTAKLFLNEGAKVVLVDINEEALSKVASELNSPNVSYVAADVTKATDVQKYVKHTVDTFGKIDVFFNNAGIEGVVKAKSEMYDYLNHHKKVAFVTQKGDIHIQKYVIK